MTCFVKYIHLLTQKHTGLKFLPGLRFVVIYIRTVRTQTGTRISRLGPATKTKSDRSEFIVRPVTYKRIKRNVWRSIRTHAGLSSSRSHVNTPLPGTENLFGSSLTSLPNNHQSTIKIRVAKRNNFKIIGDFYSQIRRPIFSKSLFLVLIFHLNDFFAADRPRDQSYRCLNEGDRRAFARAMAAFAGTLLT